MSIIYVQAISISECDSLTYMSTLSERLEQAMKEANVSQSELATYVGIKQPSVNAWISGKTKKIEGMNLIRASECLGISPEWLATGRGAVRAAEARTIYAIDKVSEPADIDDFLNLLTEKLAGEDEATRAIIGDMLKKYIMDESPNPRVANAIKDFLK